MAWHDERSKCARPRGRSALLTRARPSWPADLGESKMPSIRSLEPIHIGLVSDEPIRLEGLASVFEQPSHQGEPPLLPVAGNIAELLARPMIEYLVVDLHSSSGGLEILEDIRRARPSLKLIVIGPEGNDELVLDSIVAGARAYLELTAAPDTVRL